MLLMSAAGKGQEESAVLPCLVLFLMMPLVLRLSLRLLLLLLLLLLLYSSLRLL